MPSSFNGKIMLPLCCHCISTIKVLNAIMPVYEVSKRYPCILREPAPMKDHILFYLVSTHTNPLQYVGHWKFLAREYYSYRLTILRLTEYAYFLYRPKDHGKSKYYLDSDIKYCILI